MAITKAIPYVGRQTTAVTLQGSGFGAVQGTGGVTFDGVAAASIVSWSDTEVVATAPSGMSTDQNIPIVLTADDTSTHSFEWFSGSLTSVFDSNWDDLQANLIPGPYEGPNYRQGPSARAMNRLLEKLKLLHDFVGYGSVTATAGTTNVGASTDSVFADAAAGAVTINIPSASGITGRRILLMRLDDTYANSVTFQVVGGAESIFVYPNSLTAHGLYLKGDSVVLESDGTNWICVGGSLIPHVAKITKDNLQSIPTGATTPVDYNQVSIDIGGMVNIANSSIDPVRAGEYECFTYGQIASINYLDTWTVLIYVDSAILGFNNRRCPFGTQNIPSHRTVRGPVAVGEQLTGRVQQDFGAARNLIGEGSGPFYPGRNPVLEAREIR